MQPQERNTFLSLGARKPGVKSTNDYRRDYRVYPNFIPNIFLVDSGW